jgi:hypothetical protein
MSTRVVSRRQSSASEAKSSVRDRVSASPRLDPKIAFLNSLHGKRIAALRGLLLVNAKDLSMNDDEFFEVSAAAFGQDLQWLREYLSGKVHPTQVQKQQFCEYVVLRWRRSPSRQEITWEEILKETAGPNGWASTLSIC